MEKKVIFIEFRDYTESKKNLPYVDGVFYPGLGRGGNSGYPNALGDIGKGKGEFFSINHNESGELTVSTDFCGFYPLFWMSYAYDKKNGVLISNCFHSIAAYSECKLDPGKVVPSIVSKNQIFIQDYTNEMTLSDIKRLAWDEELLISKDGLLQKKRSKKVLGGNYWQTIAKGVSEAQETLVALSKKKTLNLYLSGGKDSRAILALMISAGVYPKCTTQNPEKYSGKSKEIVKKDFFIAASLVEKHGLDWFEGSRKYAKKISFEQSLELHSFYRNGYYLFLPSQYIVYDGEWGSEVQLRGGGGGLYKPTWGEYIKKSYINNRLQGERGSLAKDAEIIYDELVTKKVGDNDGVIQARNIFKNSLRDVVGSSEESDIYSALDSHYVSYRNRTHFGHIRSSEASGKLVLYPLINEHFYNASLMLGLVEKERGKLIFDIIEYCLPELNEFPYDDGYHDLLPSTRSRRDLSFDSLVAARYREKQDVNSGFLKGIFSGKAFNENLEACSFIDKSLKELCEGDKGGEWFKKKAFIAYVEKLKEEKRYRGKLCAVLSSMPLESVSNFSKGHIFSSFVE